MKEIIATTIITLLLATGYYYNDRANPSDFERWALKHGKFFVGEEKLYREQIYRENKEMIEAHNKDETQTYKMGENQFMTLTKEEFNELYLGKPNIEDQQTIEDKKKSSKSQISETQNFKGAVDWSKHSSVKNQLQCSTGWAFSITNQIEAYFSIYDGYQWIISAQQIFDCYYQHLTCGDRGDNGSALFQVTYFGYEFASSYPYVGYQQTCKKSSGSWTDITNYNYLLNIDQIKTSLQTQAISVGIDSSNMMFYQSGIFSNCNTSTYNHFALLVGYDVNDVWKIQNSWGTGWGESGYIRLAAGNTCGLTNSAYSLVGPYN